MSARNGIILESYARSAGTGNQPVPGEVTSRRNSSRQERQALVKKRQEEQEKMKKLKGEQEQIAKILAHKWAEEDRKRKEEKGSKRRRDDRSRSRDDDNAERRSRSRPKRDRGGSERGGGRGTGGASPPRGSAGGEEDDEEALDGEQASERVAGWVTYERQGERKERQAAASSAAGQASSGLSDPASSSSLRTEPACRPKAGSGSGGASSSQARRFTENGAGDFAVGTSSSAPSTAGVFRERDAKGETKSKAHSKKVANVFGFGVEEEDDDMARRELELAARSKRAKLNLHDTKALGDPRGGPGGGASLPAPAASRPTDMCQQLMKMAQWKRSCGGKRLPMPKDLEADVAKALGGAA